MCLLHSINTMMCMVLIPCQNTKSKKCAVDGRVRWTYMFLVLSVFKVAFCQYMLVVHAPVDFFYLGFKITILATEPCRITRMSSLLVGGLSWAPSFSCSDWFSTRLYEVFFFSERDGRGAISSMTIGVDPFVLPNKMQFQPQRLDDHHNWIALSVK